MYNFKVFKGPFDAQGIPQDAAVEPSKYGTISLAVWEDSGSGNYFTMAAAFEAADLAAYILALEDAVRG
jgi:hypothetical protein